MGTLIEYQSWTSITYAWNNSAGTTAPNQINDKLSAWVTAVNANGGNTNKQLTLLRTPASSTGTRFGWVVKFEDDEATDTFAQVYNTTATNLSAIFGSSYTDDASNNGYGTVGTVINSDTTISWQSTGVTAEFIIAQSTDANQEFFFLGWNLANSINTRDVWLIFKNQHNKWCSLVYDAVVTTGFGCQSSNKRSITDLELFSEANNLLTRCPFTADTAGSSAGVNFPGYFHYVAHPGVFMVPAASRTIFNFGGYYTANSRRFFGVSLNDIVVEEIA